jgi:hypothetical protein
LISGTGNNQISTGHGYHLLFKNWYAKAPVKSVQTLQMMTASTDDYDPTSTQPLLDNRVETFNFINLVKSFDSIRNSQRGHSSFAQ